VPVAPRPVPVAPRPVPVAPRPVPVAPRPVPVAPRPVPVAPRPVPVAPRPVPVAPRPVPVAPRPVPVAPRPVPVAPRPVPVAPRPAPVPTPKQCPCPATPVISCSDLATVTAGPSGPITMLVGNRYILQAGQTYRVDPNGLPTLGAGQKLCVEVCDRVVSRTPRLVSHTLPSWLLVCQHRARLARRRPSSWPTTSSRPPLASSRSRT
jgi:hypothetical protein